MHVGGEWVFPAEYAKDSGMLDDGRAEKVNTQVVYNFVLSGEEGEVRRESGETQRQSIV
jgi:hypothetical protein